MSGGGGDLGNCGSYIHYTCTTENFDGDPVYSDATKALNEERTQTLYPFE